MYTELVEPLLRGILWEAAVESLPLHPAQRALLRSGHVTGFRLVGGVGGSFVVHYRASHAHRI